jgi:molybdopterin converting factor small subunit
MVEVSFPSRWTAFTDGQSGFRSEAANLQALIDELADAFPDLGGRITRNDGAFALTARAVVNGSVVPDISRAGDISLSDGDRLTFIEPVAGG